MRIIRRIILVILVLVFLLGAVGAGGLFYLVRRPFPQIDGAVRLPNLISPATIIRDKLGIPHIYAGNVHDLFFAQGYVHAQDRLWQMESTRRAIAGRASELSVTKAAIESDKLFRTIGLRRAAEADYRAASEEVKAILQAYADGVNAFIDTHADRLPLEFFFIGLFGSHGPGYRPEPWTPVDSVQWAKAMAYDQSGSFRADLFRAQMLAQFGEERSLALLADLDPEYDYTNKPIIAPEGVDWERVPERLAELDQAVAGGRGPDSGSNNWVVAGTRTTTGWPLLANDPHISIQIPAIWYFNSLHCDPVGPDCPLEVIGASLLGAPGVVIGHNARIAWGLTNTTADLRDLFLEKVQGDQYEFQGQLIDLSIVPERLTIRGRLPTDYTPSPNETAVYDEAWNSTTITLNVRYTRHGPLISDVNRDAAQLEYAVAYHWTGTNAPERLLDAMWGVSRAGSWGEFRAALVDFGSPSMNVVYADIEGNIGYQFLGRLPVRARGDGRFPVPGWSGEYEWTGYVPYAELPNLFNPPQGYIATANNAVVGPDYPHFVSRDWDRGYRAQRIADRIEGLDRLSPDEVASIQGDSHNLPAEAIVPYLASFTLAGEAQRVLDAIRSWDFENRRDSAGAAAFEVFRLLLWRNLSDDEMGSLARTYASLSGGGALDRYALIRLLARPDSPWWDNTATPDVKETQEDILKKSLADAAAALARDLGPDPSGWSWGSLHAVTFSSQALGASPVAFLFNRGPFAVDGGNAIVNNTGSDFSRAYPNPDRPSDPLTSLTFIFQERQSPSLRQVVDLGDLNASRFVLTVGQSGLPYHPHYDDMIDLWRNIRYAPMWWERSSVEQNAEGTLSLTP